ncbi:hypothetical protein, partial [Stenotrophomonas sp. A3_2]|uniref:hypothetical protein n=1 Tax=Stenotrophomonas sp. A3_2 TaxID=3119978 RepID=UPI002FC29E10
SGACKTTLLNRGGKIPLAFLIKLSKVVNMLMTARKSSLAGLVTQIERGIRREDPEGSAFRTCRTLTEAVQSGGDFLPECFTVPSQDAYARRLVHAGKDFTLMAMVWQGEQGTP